MSPEFCRLVIHESELFVRLGCEAAERTQPQLVRLTVEVDFAKPPLACTTDSIDETVCYDILTQKVSQLCEGKEFKLVESLGYQIYQVVKGSWPEEKFRVRVHKVQTPLEHIRGGTSFICGDWA